MATYLILCMMIIKSQNSFFLIKDFATKNMVENNSYIVAYNRSLAQTENKIKKHMIDYTNIIKYFEMTSNSKHRTGKPKT